ncbi:hypothetical protein L1280_002518 [Deinococcus sp. HSC-46F16]|uniref:hypothetical protein n=1 Tax=Deinococcus sp. HSC-46F16 TaxID=2910968 RepID=UPI0020A1285C|nr:hypothetical protein [Deinococcus sp. HSC-46F16]MCP2015356.1 hypothetical protein [Deinococcus sp. HSC-46F16]
MSTESLQPLESALAAPLLRGLRDVMARHGALSLRARAGETGSLGLGTGGMARPVALHLTWAHPDDLARLRQAAALPADARLEEERDEVTFYADLLMALLRLNVERAEFGPGGRLAFVHDAREPGGVAFVGEGLVFAPRQA